MGLFYLSSILLVTILVFYGYDNPVYTSILRATGWLINVNLLTSIILITTTIYLLLMNLGDLDLEDFGIDNANQVLIGVFLYVVIFVLSQLVAVVVVVMSNGWQLKIDPVWVEQGVLVIFGIYLGHLFGNAIYEEIGFRAFLFPLLTKQFDTITSRKIAITAGLLISQVLFALLHFPIRVFRSYDQDIISYLFLFFYGVGLAIIYFRTANITIPIVIHAYLNFGPRVIYTYGIDISWIIPLVALLIIIFYPKIDELLRSDTQRRPEINSMETSDNSS